MAIDPIAAGTASAPISALYAARGQAIAGLAPEPGAPTADGLAVKRSLDGREAAWQGFVGGEGGEARAHEGGAAHAEKPAAAASYSGGVADKSGSDVTDAELHRIFGGEAPSVRQLLNARSELKVGDLMALRKDADGLRSLSDLLTHRSDVKLSDVLSRDAKGKVSLDSTVRDGASRELLYSRTDMKPGELTSLRGQLGRLFDNPSMAKAAYSKSLDLLKTRTDIRPADVSGMLSHLGLATRSTKGGGGAEGQAALFDMFDRSAKLLTTRTDLGASDVNKLVDATSQSFGGRDSQNGLSNMRDAFSSATDLLGSRQGMSVGDVTNVMGTVDQHFGKDGDNKLSAFQKATNLMTHVPQLDAHGVGRMFQKAAEGPPAQGGDKLVQAFDNAAGNVMSGKTNLTSATTPREQQTDRQQHEQKTVDEQTRVNTGRLRTAKEQEERDQRDPLGLTAPGQVPDGKGEHGTAAARTSQDGGAGGATHGSTSAPETGHARIDTVA